MPAFTPPADDSASKYRLLVESIDEGFCVVEMIFDEAGKPFDYRFLDVNPSFAKLTGIPDAPGKTMREIAPDLEDRWFETYGRIATTGKPERFEGHSGPLDRWFDVFASRHGGPESRKVAILFNNVTERKQTEIALRESEERLRLFIEHAPAAVAMFDREMRYLAVSQRWKEDYGLQGEILGRCQYEVFADLPAHWRESHRRSLAGSVEQSSEDRFVRPDGTTGWLMWEVRPWFLGTGNIGGIVIFSEDITARKLALDELANLNQTLESRVAERTSEFQQALGSLETEIAERRHAEERANQLAEQLAARVDDLAAVNAELETFAYTVSHDLRAPLRHVSGFVRLLAEDLGDHLEGLPAEHIHKILGATARMGQLIDGLLDFSRLGRTSLRCTQVDVTSLIEEVRSTLQQAGENRTLDWKIGPLPAVWGDPSMLRQVFANLLENALKFTRNEPAGVVEISCESRPAEHVFRIHDNGTGFDPAYGEKLFGVFQRLHSDKDFEGTGIGLATVRRIIARHGGRTWAHGRPGDGADFYFSLPRNKPAP